MPDDVDGNPTKVDFKISMGSQSMAMLQRMMKSRGIEEESKMLQFLLKEEAQRFLAKELEKAEGRIEDLSFTVIYNAFFKSGIFDALFSEDSDLDDVTKARVKKAHDDFKKALIDVGLSDSF